MSSVSTLSVKDNRNMKIKLPLLVVICWFWKTQNGCLARKSVDDHYWRDYNGLVPTDAIPGGSDESGTITYIGQFPVVAEYNYEISNIHLLPATITKGSEGAVAAYHGRSVASNETTNVKIMCSSNSNYRYKWLNKSADFSPNCYIVTGGLEDNIPMYIGRATEGRQKVIGKVFSVTTVHTPNLICPYQGGELIHENYELLTYCY